jgi:hypothetical protein
MLILIMSHPDGDTYQLSDNLNVLEKKFEKLKEERFYSRLVLADVKSDVAFGFGSQGEFFGGEVILEWDENDDE